MTEHAIKLLEQQQRTVKEHSAPWMVAEQLKDICRRESASAELIVRDLENPEMGIVQAEKRIKAFADSHKTGNFSCVTPTEAEGILREFYGLGASVSAQSSGISPKVLNLADFL